jgi:hypothetical protein
MPMPSLIVYIALIAPAESTILGSRRGQVFAWLM